MLPTSPTVTPEKARRPREDMLNRPMTRPRIAGGARICTRLWVIELNDSSRKPAANSSIRAPGYQVVNAKQSRAVHQAIASSTAVRGLGASQPRPSSRKPAVSAPAASAASSML